VAIDARQIDAATTPLRYRDEWCRIQLFGKSGIQRDTPTRSQMQPAINVVSDLLREELSVFGREGAAPQSKRFA
jgi:hypothetical protein